MTTDRELRTRIKRHWAGQRPEESNEWLEDRAAVMSLIESLPTCTMRGDRGYRCGNIATILVNRDDPDEGMDMRCDACPPDERFDAENERELSYAPALRALLQRVRQWDGEER